MTTLFLLLWALDRRLGPLDRKDITATFLKILSAAALMGATIWVFLRYSGLDLETAMLPAKILHLAIVLIIGLLSFLVLSFILRLKELDRILVLVKIKKNDKRLGG
jgi:peptidoglycan biosynthesis protein MviN/MurJ (putative lipid II flippase)